MLRSYPAQKYAQATLHIVKFNVAYALPMFLLCCSYKAPVSDNELGIDSFYLAKSNSIHNIVLSTSFLQNPAEAMQFMVTVGNKRLEAFTVFMSITDSTTSIPVGNFTAYPLNKGGSYVFRMDAPVKKFLSEKSKSQIGVKPIYLQFMLHSDADISNEFRVEIHHFQWVQKLG